MLFRDHLILIRGGGDLATGVVARLHRAGFPLLVLELAHPLVVRRTVAVAAAVAAGVVQIEDLTARRATSLAEAVAAARRGEILVLAAAELPPLDPHPTAVIDARMAKRNIDTRRDQAPLVVAPGWLSAAATVTRWSKRCAGTRWVG